MLVEWQDTALHLPGSIEHALTTRVSAPAGHGEMLMKQCATLTMWDADEEGGCL